jgi:regulator of ribosome biosynthesis
MPAASDKPESGAKSIEVNKAVEPNVDLGNLLLEDFDPLDADQYKTNGGAYLKEVARNNAQFLVNKLWQLPTKRIEDVIVAVLPKPTAILPREKAVPKVRPLTKWQQYAKTKGILNKKKDRKVWDGETQTWKPTWGYQRANNPEADWMVEIPDQKDPYRDYYGERKDEKKERVAKNELQRLRNIAKASGGGPAAEGIGMNLEKKNSKEVAKQLDRALHSTASLGKYNEKLSKERPVKEGKKRKFEPNETAISKEKDKSLEIWKRMDTKKPKLDIEKAVSTKIRGRGKKAERTNDEDDDDDFGGETQKKRKRSSGSGGRSKARPSKGSKRRGKMHDNNKKKHPSKGKR